MENQFSKLGVKDAIIKSLDEMGFIAPTEVQEKVIPQIIEGKDLIVLSKTGSGKTGAFGIPLIQKIDASNKGPQALILTPTRELAVQVDSDLKKMSKHVRCYTTAVYGQHNINVEVQALDKGISILTGTPGRVLDHIRQGNFKTSSIQYLVLDEADRMLDMGFIDQVEKIIKAMPKNRVTLLFSATMPPEIQSICKSHMKEPVSVEITSETKTVDAIEQIYYRVAPNDKRTQLNRLLKVENPDTCMIFCNTRATVDRIQIFLKDKGYTVDSLHGANSQSSRLRTINNFKKGCYQILVATDVAARGIHVEDLSLVINYDVPLEKDSYVHRIGRTGRAGQMGKAISLVTTDEIMSLYEIEEHVGCLIEEMELPTEEQYQEALKKLALEGAKVRPLPSGAPTTKIIEGPKNSPKKPTGSKSGSSKNHHNKPSNNKPAYEKPNYEKLNHEKPSYEKPNYSKPSYEKKKYSEVQKPKHPPIIEKSTDINLSEKTVSEPITMTHNGSETGIIKRFINWFIRK